MLIMSKDSQHLLCHRTQPSLRLIKRQQVALTQTHLCLVELISQAIFSTGLLVLTFSKIPTFQVNQILSYSWVSRMRVLTYQSQEWCTSHASSKTQKDSWLSFVSVVKSALTSRAVATQTRWLATTADFCSIHTLGTSKIQKIKLTSSGRVWTVWTTREPILRFHNSITLCMSTEEFRDKERERISMFLNLLSKQLKSMMPQPIPGRRSKSKEHPTSRHSLGALSPRDKSWCSVELMETFCKRATILLILIRRRSKSKMNLLAARLPWANLFTDQSPKNCTALVDMDLEDRTLRPLWGLASHGTSLREAMLHYLVALSQAKVRKSSWFSTQVSFSSDQIQIQEL